MEACKARKAKRLSQEGGCDVAAVGQNPAHNTKKNPRGTRMIPMRTPQRNLRIPCPSTSSIFYPIASSHELDYFRIRRVWLGKPSPTCETRKRQDDHTPRRGSAKCVSADWGAEFLPSGLAMLIPSNKTTEMCLTGYSGTYREWCPVASRCRHRVVRETCRRRGSCDWSRGKLRLQLRSSK